ncbi:MAG: zinc ABC transporter substrate-binding protein [Minisyncoccia bacterium]
MPKNKDIAIFITIAVLLIGGVLFARSRSVPTLSTPANTKLQVTSSFYPLYFFATQIAGNKADITNITPTGAEPHDYEPSVQNIIEMNNSRLLILNGGGLEAWGDKVTQTLDPLHTLTITVGKDITNQRIIEGSNNVIDPHIWLSPLLAKNMVRKIVAGLEQVDPANSAYYEANAQTLTQKLSDLDALYKNGLANCAQRDIVTSHSAFGYLATAYHLNQVPIVGLSPDAEPSPKALGVVIDFAKKNNVKYIFFESLASPKLSETIAREVGAQTLVLNPIEGLTPNEMVQGKDYFTEMQSNLKSLQLALECAN